MEKLFVYIYRAHNEVSIFKRLNQAATMQNIKTYQPSPALAPYISNYRIINFPDFGNQAISFRDYPRAAMDMIFLFKGKTQLSANTETTFDLNPYSFVGLFEKAYDIIPTSFTQGLDIRFKPNGVYPLTKVPLHLALNQQLSLDDLLGHSVKELHEQLGHESTDLGKIKLLEQYLLTRYQKSDLHHRVEYGLQLIDSHQGNVSVKKLSEALNTNYKSLDRWFQKHIGLPPKRIMQHVRFKNILERLQSTQEPDWMQFVTDFGFYDQAHFIKEFKQFARVSPTRFLQEEANLDKHFSAVNSNAFAAS